MISVSEAQKVILAEVARMGEERVLLDAALGRTLSRDLNAPINHPPWDSSEMDGYAIRHADTASASRLNPQKLKVVEEIPAGVLPKLAIEKGEASKIMTGAPLPAGADAVVKVEDTEKIGDEALIYGPSEPGDYIRFIGEAMKKGDQVLQKGLMLRAPEIAMMASFGKSVVPVFQQPRVAILSTGDELAELDEPRGADKILNSNGYGLAAQVAEAGGLPINLGIAKDTKADLLEKMQAGLSADFLLISGGVSMGDYDFVIEVLEQLGVKMHFWKVAMKPGKPLAFGTLSGRPVFGLPGNPVSSMVTFEQFVRPALLKALGRERIFRPQVTATLEERIQKRPGRQQFLRAVVFSKAGELHVRSSGKQDSATLSSLVKANSLMVLPPEGTRIEKGERVQVQLLSEIH